jgi:chemotaxis-related protein WspB
LGVLFLLFHLDQACYALDTAEVSEVLPLLAIRAIPRAPAAVAGMIDYHGLAVPIVDLSQLALGRPAQRHLSTRILLVRHADAKGTARTIGLIAERATRTLRCEPTDFHASGVSDAGAPYLGGVASLPMGLVQRVEVGAILTAELSALFFAEGPGQ